jgi:hypothetical protein
MDDLFDLNLTEPEPNIVPQEEFFDKTKKLISDVHNAYIRAYYSRVVSDDIRPEESICEACTGCGIIKDESGGPLECYQNREEGDCYVRVFDAEQFGIECEDLMGQVWELMSVDKISTDIVK